MTITRKVLLPTLLILGIGFLGLLLVQAQNDLRVSAANEQSSMEFLFQTWQSRLQAMESFAVALAMETAEALIGGLVVPLALSVSPSCMGPSFSGIPA